MIKEGGTRVAILEVAPGVSALTVGITVGITVAATVGVATGVGNAVGAAATINFTGALAGITLPSVVIVCSVIV